MEPNHNSNDKRITLQDLLSPEIVPKLKTQKHEIQAIEEKRIAAEKQLEEEVRKVEEKRLENDFEYLLNQSLGKPRK